MYIDSPEEIISDGNLVRRSERNAGDGGGRIFLWKFVNFLSEKYFNGFSWKRKLGDLGSLVNF